MRIYDAEYFDPCATLECGQIFRYERLDKDNYIVYSKDKKCHLIKSGDKVSLTSSDDDYFENFFDLCRDYGAINKQLCSFSELKDAAIYGKGIRILKQDLYETIISFIISANNNIPRIKGIIDKLCKAYGEEKQGYNAFPNQQSLVDVTASEYRDLGAGFRDKYLAKTVKNLTQGYLQELAIANNDMAFNLLCSLSGVGAKVANCIMLFGLARLDRFPVDVWMFRACKTDALNTPSKVNAYYSERYGSLAGIAQQYIFYNARKKSE